MRRTAALLFLLIWSPLAWGAVSSLPGCTASGTSCTPSASQIGDVMVAFAAHTGATTTPTNPAGWTSITTGTVTGDIGYRLTCKVANSAAETASGFTNATYLAVRIWRGTNITGSRNCGAIGTPVKNSSTGTTSYAYGGLTLTNDGGSNTSYVGGFLVLDGSSSNGMNAPAGMTEQAFAGTNGTGPGAAIQDTNGTVTSWSTTNVTGGTAVPYAAVTFEVNAAPSMTACSGTCASLVDDRPVRTNDTDDVTSATYKFDLANAALGGNAIALGVTYDGTVTSGVPTPSITITDNNGGNTWVNDVFCSDGSHVAGIVHALNVAAGTLHLTATLGVAASDFAAHPLQLKNVATSSAVDGTPSCTANQAGPSVSAGSITTTQSNDVIFAFNAADGYCCTTLNASFFPGPGFNLLGPDPSLGNAAEILNWGGSGAINPALYVGTASNTNGMAAIAFKTASAGTAPTGIWAYCKGAVGMSGGTAASFNVQMPCPAPVTPNLIVVDTNSIPSDFTISAVADTDSNTYSSVVSGPNWVTGTVYAAGAFILPTSNNTGAYMFQASAACTSGGTQPSPWNQTVGGTSTDGGGGCTWTNTNRQAGFPQMYYAQNAAFTNTNTRYATLTNNHASTTVVEWYVIAGADTTAIDGHATNSGTQLAAGGSTCTNSSSVNSTATLTPSTNRSGVMIWTESNGTGPECATSTPYGLFDAFWYAGETDGNTHGYTGSGFGSLPYTSNAAATYTANWANATASTWDNLIAAFKAAASSATPHPPLWVIQPGGP